MGYMAFMRINGSHFRGGHIISHGHVLTAEECIFYIKMFGEDNKRFITVMTGNIDLSRDRLLAPIEKVEHHPLYQAPNQRGATIYGIGVVMVNLLTLNIYT